MKTPPTEATSRPTSSRFKVALRSNFLQLLTIIGFLSVVAIIYYNPLGLLGRSSYYNANKDANQGFSGPDQVVISTAIVDKDGDDIPVGDDIHHAVKTLEDKENRLDSKLDLYRQYLKTYTTILTGANEDVEFTKQLAYLNKITFPLILQAALGKIAQYNQALIIQNQQSTVVFPRSNSLIDKILRPVIQIRSLNKLDKKDVLRSMDVITEYVYSKTFMRRFTDND